MAEFTAATVQTVAPNDNVLLNTSICGGKNVVHRNGSGLATLRGISNGQCRARYKAIFNANIAIPTGGTVRAISLALSLNGESVDSTKMIVTPVAVENYFNVAASIYIDVPIGCCTQLAVKNTSTQPILVANPNLIVDRTA